MKLKKLSLLAAIDTSFLALVYFVVVYVLRTIKDSLALIQSFAGDLQGASILAQENSSMVDVGNLLQNLETINQIASKITMIGVGSFVLLFILYCLVQSIQWSLIFESFKNYKNYLMKFASVSFGYCIFLFVIGYYLLINLKEFIPSFWFSNNFKGEVFFYIVVLLFLILVLSYFMQILYVYLRKHTISEASNLAMKAFCKNYKLGLLFLVTFIVILGFVVISVRSVSGIVFNILELFIVSLIFNSYRIYLYEKIK